MLQQFTHTAGAGCFEALHQGDKYTAQGLKIEFKTQAALMREGPEINMELASVFQRITENNITLAQRGTNSSLNCITIMMPQ